MELLLNLVWASVAIGALIAFLRVRRSSAPVGHVSYLQGLIALACVVWLLFPIVSASDDLHPTQAVVEDATKRMQQRLAPLHQLNSPAMAMLPAALLWALLFTLVVLHWSSSTALAFPLPAFDSAAFSGRAPPAF